MYTTGTYVWEPAAVAGALAGLDLLDDAMRNAIELERIGHEILMPLDRSYEQIGDVRQYGAWAAVEFVQDKASQAPNCDAQHAFSEAALRAWSLRDQCPGEVGLSDAASAHHGTRALSMVVRAGRGRGGRGAGPVALASRLPSSLRKRAIGCWMRKSWLGSVACLNRQWEVLLPPLLTVGRAGSASTTTHGFAVVGGSDGVATPVGRTLPCIPMPAMCSPWTSLGGIELLTKPTSPPYGVPWDRPWTWAVGRGASSWRCRR